jgi:hypothetical protein
MVHLILVLVVVGVLVWGALKILAVLPMEATIKEVVRVVIIVVAVVWMLVQVVPVLVSMIP